MDASSVALARWGPGGGKSGKDGVKDLAVSPPSLVRTDPTATLVQEVSTSLPDALQQIAPTGTYRLLCCAFRFREK